MIMISRPDWRTALPLALLAAMLPVAAHAQTLPSGGSAPATEESSADEGDDGGLSLPRGKHKGRVTVIPYIEASQVALVELSPGSDVLTYTALAAGVDAGINARNLSGSASVRYERRIGWGDRAVDSDTISGLARVSASVIPRTLSVEAGAIAARTSVQDGGSAVLGPLDLGDSITQIYSVYAGPTLTTRVGDVTVDGSYRIGYTRVESPNAVILPGGSGPIDLYDEGVSQSAAAHAFTRAGEVLPIGLGLSAGYNREDISNLDQKVEDFSVRADATLPIGSSLALVAGVGYEDVEVSGRDAVRGPGGVPIIGPDGRYVTDAAAPRAIAYDTNGLIWDAGVIWRPSRRTALEAHIGKRYGSTTYYGSFAYAPTARSSFNVSVYDNISGFGGKLTSSLASLTTQFEAIRNPLTGDLGGCVVPQPGGANSAPGAVQGQTGCLGGALGSVRSSIFRSRGVMASYALNLGRFQAGFGAGYDRRKFIGAPGTVLALANGVVDESIWTGAYFNGQLDRDSSFTTGIYANWYQSGDALGGEVIAFGANASYARIIADHLTATAALGIDGVSRDLIDDIWSASALVGVRYSF